MTDITASHPDRAAAERFIEALTGSVDAQVCFRTFTDSPDKPSPDPLASKRTGTLGSCWNWLCSQSSKGAGVYMVINAGGHTGESIAGIRAYFVDFDAGQLPPESWPVQPSMIVKTVHGWHVYWLAQPGESVEGFTATQMHLINALNCDPKPKDLSRVMRVPGFAHQKDRSNPRLIDLASVDARMRYTAADLRNGFRVAESAEPSQSGQVDSAALARALAKVPGVTRLRRAKSYLEAVGPAIPDGAGGGDTRLSRPLIYRIPNA